MKNENTTNETLKIAMIGHKEFPSRRGGVEVVVQELATRLASDGHEVTVYNRGGDKANNGKKVQGVTVYIGNSPRETGTGALIASIQSTFEMFRHPCDVVHYHAIGPAVMVPIAKLFRKKTVVTVHGLDWQRSKWGAFARAYLKFGERMAMRFADAVITVSQADYDYFLNKYHKKTELIENAVTAVEPLEPHIITEKWNLTKNSYILYLGRIDKVKGIQYLLDAYQEIETDKTLVIAGNVENKDEYAKAILERIKTMDRVMYVGAVSGDALRELYSNCCLYVLPSEMEGFPLSLLEALSAGARCLASDIPVNSKVLENFGNVFASMNANSLREQLDNLLNQPDENPKREEQMALIRAYYHYDRLVEDTVKVYRQVAQQKKKCRNEQ